LEDDISMGLKEIYWYVVRMEVDWTGLGLCLMPGFGIVKGVRNCPNLEWTVQISATTHSCDNSVPSSGAVCTRAPQRSAWARLWYDYERI
jgi:hypothetical protein